MRQLAAPYLAYALIAFKNQFAYRIANWAGLFTNLFFMFFRAYVFVACFQGVQEAGGYSLNNALTYTVVTQALLMVCPQWRLSGLGESVRSGQVATDICRPIGFFVAHMCRRMGVSAYYFLVRAIPIVVVGVLVGFIPLQFESGQIVTFLLSVAMGAWIAHCMLFLVELSAFWLESEMGTYRIYTGFAYILTGVMIPIAFFPDWAISIASLLPFFYMLNIPSEVFMGIHVGENLLVVLASQLAWAIGMSFVCQVALFMGSRKLVIHGG